MKKTFLLLAGFAMLSQLFGQNKTYANPMNLDYGYTPIPAFANNGKHRATADPVIVNHKGTYYLFSTNQWGYWWSDDLSDWHFVERKFLREKNKVYDELCAPAVRSIGDDLVVIGSTHTKEFTLWKSSDPKNNQWESLVDDFQVGAWDPDIFYDEEQDRVYIYWGSSNVYPLYGQELDRKTFQPIGDKVELITLNDQEHGWERFGEYNDNTFLQPFMEGAWMTKYKGKYYLQYGAPGTEFSGYGDGVYVSDKPLGGFQYQSHNPFSYKPGGFIRGAGHGATFQDNFENWWHITTGIISLKNNFERRNVLFPSGFDKDGVLYSNTAYGDYPTYLPTKTVNHSNNNTPGWMLLNFNKPVQVSSTLGGYKANYLVDEDIKTYWSAKTGNKGENIISDLEDQLTIHAIQINYADQDAEFLGKTIGKNHQYILYGSNDQKKWSVIVDKSKNTKDVPHDYIELKKPVKYRYVKLENIKMPTGKFAISGFRIFGKGNGDSPKPVENFIVLRTEPRKKGERRSAWLKWKQNPNADGYVIYFGKKADKLYGSIMVYNNTEYYFTGMDFSDEYFFQIEAFNENGISEKTAIINVK